MIRTAAELEPVLDAIRGGSEVAVDTEFHSERHFYPRLMLVQLRVDDGPAVLVDPLEGLDLAPLGAALSTVPLLVHGGSMDIQILHRVCGLRPCRVFDTQIAAGCVGDGFPVRLQELVRLHLDLRVAKGETLSDWSARPLSEDQARYAADDVLLLPPLARALRARLLERGTAEIAAAAMDEHRLRALAPDDDGGAWRSVGGAHLLDDAERAALQALTAWREGAARDRDQPRSNVVSDSMLLDLARRLPATVDAMRTNRRMPNQVWKRDGAAVLACIAAGREAVPPRSLNPRARPWTDLVMAAARTAESQRGVAVELALNGPALERIAVGEPLEDWRILALGPEFFAFLKGGVTLSMPGIWRSADTQ